MTIHIHPHARMRMSERGATESEVRETVQYGERFPAKYGRIGIRKNFVFDSIWKNKRYQTKQLEVFAVEESEESVVVSLLV